MLVRILIPIVILACGFGAWKWLGIPVEEPQPERQAVQKLKTERLEMTPTDYPVVLETQGTVRAHHTTTITSLVPGTIRVIHPCFEDGAFFNEGEILAELDPADLQAALTAAESRLARADALLAQEEARAKQAKLNWQDIGYDEEPSPLVLRVPQLNEAKAVVSSARADVDQARRNLERTKIPAWSASARQSAEPPRSERFSPPITPRSACRSPPSNSPSSGCHRLTKILRSK